MKETYPNRRCQRITANLLILMITFMMVLPYFPGSIFSSLAASPGDSIVAYGDGFHHYCIDGYGNNNALIKGDVYQYILPSQTLTKEEKAVIFWSMLTLQYSFGNVSEINKVIYNINEKAPEKGLPTINKNVTEEDLKKIIHKNEIRQKYPWMEEVLAHEKEYLEMAGLLGRGSATSVSGRRIPLVLQGHTEASNPVVIDKNTFTLPFDSNGGDADFIAKVKMKFSPTGEEGSYREEPVGGWVCQKTETSIIFRNSNPEPQNMIVQLDAAGTEYEATEGFSTPQEVYENCLQVWMCTKCVGTHVLTYKGDAPLEKHQRLVFVEINQIPSVYYAAISSSPVNSGKGEMQFRVYRHQEDFISNYNIQMYKYDHETGKPLENAVFNLYERFDHKDAINEERDGAVQIYKGGSPYKSRHKDNPVIWNDFRFVTSIFTDEKGYAKKTIQHGYHYDKTFCDGHPAPEFVPVPSPEYDEEGNQINEGEIDSAQNENRKLAQTWINCLDACQEKAQGNFSGVHFHWMMDSVEKSIIESILDSGGSSGTTPDAGTKVSAQGDTAYEKSGCQEDANHTYEKFISLKYSYALKEETARAGYTNHGNHKDDLPIEIITTDASENGARAYFSGEYSHQIKVGENLSIQWNQAVPEESGEAMPYGMTGKREEIIQKEGSSIFQKIIKLFLTIFGNEKEEADEGIELINDLENVGTPSQIHHYTKATAANASSSNALVSNALTYANNRTATKANADRTSRNLKESRFASSTVFSNAYNSALSGSSSGHTIPPGPEDNYSHCSDSDKEGNAFRIYDHRTEGEIHINKRDMQLLQGEKEDYNSYGDSQGDGSLEGAVYGLFAAKDIVHPDGKTGVVYKANHLVAVTATDKEGDASFLVHTEAPGYIYDYDQGKIREAEDGWSQQAPDNLYVADVAYDDYTAGSNYKREYFNNQKNNKNCWIGRPLLLGDYYVKELSRSEGYELSIGNRQHELTNQGQDCHIQAAEEGEGYANVTQSLFCQEQISHTATGAYNDPDYNELFFTVKSQSTGHKGFDMVLNNLPDGAKLYRLDKGMQTKMVEVGTGIYYPQSVYDDFGNPVYVVAESDYAYPKYNVDGSLMTVDVAVNGYVRRAISVQRKPLDEIITRNSILSATDGISQEEVLECLGKNFQIDQLDFIKEKIANALVVNGKRISQSTSSAETTRTQLGEPIVSLEIPKTDSFQAPISNGDMIASILDYYNTNAHYQCGGLVHIEEEADQYVVTVYAGMVGNPEDFFVPDTMGDLEGVLYHRVEYVPDDPAESPRYIYAAYGQTPSDISFGTYKEAVIEEIGGSFFLSAVLITEAQALGDGTLISKTEKENVYYKKGTIPLDASGSPLIKTEYREYTNTESMEVEVGAYVEIPIKNIKGEKTAHVDSSYMDFYGGSHQDVTPQTYDFRILLPHRFVVLSREDIKILGSKGDWREGDTMGAAAYYKQVAGGNVKTYLDYANRLIGEENSYIKTISLVYPGQNYIWQDGENHPGTNTRVEPVGVEERAIRQQIQIVKTTEEMHLPNFRFKIYLKSNLQRLYRDEKGEVVWTDRKGNPIDVRKVKAAFPEKVSKIYTKVPHRTTPLYQDSQEAVEANELLYGYENQMIKKEQNPGYTQILEQGNYKKFFQGIKAANQDKWDDNTPSYTNWQPLGNMPNRTEEAVKNTRVSDNVRQFAIDWYLDAEVKKLMTEKPDKAAVAYGDQLHDLALYQAIIKAENYLKPFFAYDLDEIYGISWDTGDGGGMDKDGTTLSADTPRKNEKGTVTGYEGVSAYLPYGTYVVVEQQPGYDHQKDLKNKHYKVDVPQEITLPESQYSYNPEASMEELEKNCHIRWGEEEHIIYAHNRDGDFQVYKYGLSLKKITGGVPDNVGKGDYFALTQSVYRPYKNYYNEDDSRREGENPYYLTEDESGKKAVSAYYRYSSVSESGKGRSSEMLTPFSLLMPKTIKFHNRVYKTKLRIEKRDSVTHENILHHGALFVIYRAKQEQSIDGQGRAVFYEKDTTITGSREFLSAMGAENIRPLKRSLFSLGVGERYSGVVPAGTPVCRETDMVVQEDETGVRTGLFKAHSTVLDGFMKDTEESADSSYRLQTVGYVETPQPLAAGTYVLCELAAPAGYERSKPIALEVYSDKITYYKEGNREERVLAAVYERASEILEAGEACTDDLARISVENKPISLQVEKRKESSKEYANTTPEKTVTYKVSGRVDGRLAEIGNDPALEYAYLNGDYQGYAWKKGTLEYLAQRKAAGEQVEIVYEGSLFAGYGYVTRILGSAEDENGYVPGALMTLRDALLLTASGDTQDHAYEGLVVERNNTNQVARMYVQSAWAGEKVGYVNEEGIWLGKTLQRPDTDILYYPLDQLEVTKTEQVDGKKIFYGYDRNHNKIPIDQMESDKKNIEKTDREHSVYAFRKGKAYLEFVGGDFGKIQYDHKDKVISVDKGTQVYHLDQDGNRDCLVDPYTGMAYVEFENNGKTTQILVWAVNLYRDSQGKVISTQKIHTSRVATVGENRKAEQAEVGNEETGYVTGTWVSEKGEKSHKNQTGNNGTFKKEMSPFLDEHGLPIYYPTSKEVYDKTKIITDWKGNHLSPYGDHLEAYNSAAYQVQEHDLLYGDQNQLYHRQGEGYVMENTWLTGDLTPNDPFAVQLCDGQPDILKRVPAGTYIMEELEPPRGYVKGFPQGIRVEAVGNLQKTSMVDRITKVEISKIDGAVTEQKGAYSFRLLEGATLGIFPEGEESPVKTWVTGKEPYYLEGLPVGKYILKELDTPEGFLPCEPFEFTVSETPEVLSLMMYDDHTKVEIKKFFDNLGAEKILSGAEFILYDNHTQKAVDVWWTKGAEDYEKFITAFEEMYCGYGAREGNQITWMTGEKTEKAVITQVQALDGRISGGMECIFPTSAILLCETQQGEVIRITVYGETGNKSGRDFTFEYQFDYHLLPGINSDAASWTTVEGVRRIDYLPVEGEYRLEETSVPRGFTKAEDVIFQVKEQKEPVKISIKNREGILKVLKAVDGWEENTQDQQLQGAVLALYKAGADEEFVNDENYLVDRWVTKGKEPHVVRRLEKGVYWLVELESPNYYILAEPVKIYYEHTDEIQMVKMMNAPVKGELTIQKRDIKNNPLKGAVYQLDCYKEKDLQTPVATQRIISITDEICIKDLPVGEADEMGRIAPYLYCLQEIVPPAGYKVTKKVFPWTFSPDGNGISYKNGETAKKEVAVINEETEIFIGKKSLDPTDHLNYKGGYLDGAQLAVYRGEGSDKEIPEAVWTTSPDAKNHALKGLTAGGKYLLKEIKSPFGYYPIKPISFALSEDGRSIVLIANGDLEVNLYSAVSAALKGKYGIATTYEEERSETLYTLREITSYSDGSREITRQIVRPLPADEKQVEQIKQENQRKLSYVEIKLCHEDGSEVVAFRPSEANDKYTIDGSSGREIFQAGEIYYVEESTVYTDGSRYTGETFAFSLNREGEVDQIEAIDKRTQVYLSKIDIASGQELPGCDMSLWDMNGKRLESWVSTTEPHLISGMVHPGETYILREENPTPGYYMAEDILFTIPMEGGVIKVVCENKKEPSPYKPDGNTPTDKPKTLIGRITAEYVPGGRFAVLWEQIFYRDEENRLWIRLPGTGDRSRRIPASVLIVLILGGFGGIIIIRKRKIPQ